METGNKDKKCPVNMTMHGKTVLNCFLRTTAGNTAVTQQLKAALQRPHYLVKLVK